MTLIKAAKLAREALQVMLAAERATNRPPETTMQAEQKLDRIRNAARQCEATITALDQAISEAEQQNPVAYIHRQGSYWEVSTRPLLDDEKARGWTEEPLYTAPPKREWQGLTDE